LQPSQQQTHLLSNIQLLRAVAALLVLLHHALPHYNVMGGHSPLIETLSMWGFLGVDIFFVISGYIMAYTTFNKPRTSVQALRFLKHRLFRIYLGYWPFLLAMALILYIKDPQKLFGLDWIGSFFLTQVDMFKLILPVSWSLSYELYFYFLFLFTFFISVKKLYIFIPLFVTFILGMVLYADYSPDCKSSFFYSPFLLEFFSGVLIYMYRSYLMKSWLLPITFLLILFAYSYGFTYETKNGLPRILTFGTGASSLILFVTILETKHFFRTGKLLTALGNASYTLYLSHLIILELFYSIGLRDLFTSDKYSWIPLFGLLSIILLCIIFSLIYYRKIEKPLYQKAIHYR
jgi:peptidoglycan/LPS O-acetylase OafA/YrhL